MAFLGSVKIERSVSLSSGFMYVSAGKRPIISGISPKSFKSLGMIYFKRLVLSNPGCAQCRRLLGTAQRSQAAWQDSLCHWPADRPVRQGPQGNQPDRPGLDRIKDARDQRAVSEIGAAAGTSPDLHALLGWEVHAVPFLDIECGHELGHVGERAVDPELRR